jgi:hypothetical protein
MIYQADFHPSNSYHHQPSDPSIMDVILMDENQPYYDLIAQWLEHLPGKEKIMGSIFVHSKIHVADFTFLVRRINVNRHTLSAYVFLL